MLNFNTHSVFAPKVSVDPKAFPMAPAATPKATAKIGDTWNYKPRDPEPTLVIPSAPAAPSNWFDKLLGVVSATVPFMRESIHAWKQAPQVLEDARDIGQGLFGVAQGAWNAVSNWFSRPATPTAPAAQAPAASDSEVLPEPIGTVYIPTMLPPVTQDKPEEVTEEQLAEQERNIRRRVRVVLGRDATEAEVAKFQKRLAEGATLSDIHESLWESTEAKIGRIFEEEVGRKIDDRGRAYWMNEYRNGESLENIRTRIHVIVGKSREQ